MNHTEVIRKLVLALPEVEEGIAYGTPVFRIRGKILARIHEDGESLVLQTDFEAREILIQTEPDVYYITEHYRNLSLCSCPPLCSGY